MRRRIRFVMSNPCLCVMSVAISVSGTEASGQAVVYVDQNSPGPTHDGSTWCNAFQHLQDATPAALAGTTIRVADGTYKPDQGAGQVPGDRTATFRLISGVTLEGGYAGCGAAKPDERNIEVHESILSGDLLGDDADHSCTVDSPDCDANGKRCADNVCIIKDNNSENSYHVVTGSGAADTAIFDGFTVSGGNANGPSPDNLGAGMLNSGIGSNPTIRRCKFTNNSAGNRGHGGGMTNNFGASPTVIGCQFIQNFAADNGGGMYNYQGSPKVIDCTFFGNVASKGGGMLNDHTKTIAMNCLFADNTVNGPVGGGGMWHTLGDDLVSGCTFSGNSATTHGGGAAIFGGNVSFDNCIFWGNVDVDGIDESAQIHIDSGTATVDYSDVQGGWTGAGGTGNIDADPLFVDMGTDNYRLLSGSPCIDAADNDSVPPDVADLDGDGNTTEPTPFDLDGAPRFANDSSAPNTGKPGSVGFPIVDMGAYERGCEPADWRVQNLTTTAWYCGIQDAIAAASDGDEIVANPGTYFEKIDFIGKAITLRSLNGFEVTTIDGTGLNDSVVKCVSGEGLDTVLDGFTITGGNASFGGGMLNENSSPTVAHCVFRENAATNGGGMANISISVSSSPMIIDCVFLQNTAYQGGGMNNNGTDGGPTSDPNVVNCMFDRNTATGGGAGMFNNNGASAVVTNCAFLANSDGVAGGGMANGFSSPGQVIVTNCTFEGNSAGNSGGGMHNGLGDSGEVLVSNCVFWNNSDSGGIDESAQIHQTGAGTTSITHSCIEGLSSFAGNSNIGDNPLFDANLRLGPGSPCIDAGDNTAVPADVMDLDGDGNVAEPIPLDLAGITRFLDDPDTPDTGNPGPPGPIVDMGAFEFFADCNENDIPDEDEPDGDDDGVIDVCDGCPIDPDKAGPGFCGCSDSPTDCSDGKACTTDSCDEELDECVATINSGTCLIDDTCFGDGELNPLNPCESCDSAASGIDWTALPDTTACPDDTVCNGDETCQAGLCAAGDPLICDDNNVCTANSCDPVLGCIFDGTGVSGSCDDENVCTSGDVCQGDTEGTCLGSEPNVEAPQQPAGEAGFPTNRYLSFITGNPGQQTAVRLTFIDLPPPHHILNGTTKWVGQPQLTSENAGLVNPNPSWPNFKSARIQCTPFFTDWSEEGIVHIYNQSILAGGTYSIQVIDQRCDVSDEARSSDPLEVVTSVCGDVAGPSVGGWPPPDDSVDVPFDIVPILEKFGNLPGAPLKARVDLEPNIPDQLINIGDVLISLDAFRGIDCPSGISEAPCSE